MGAWGYGPFCNDEALDWVDGISREIARTIRRTLLGFLKQKHRRQRRFKVRPGTRVLPPLGYPGGHHEAIGAAALLDELTPYRKADKPARSGAFRKGAILSGKVEGTTLSLHWEAESLHLYSLAVRAIEAILKNDLGWIDQWDAPGSIRTMLVGLCQQLAQKIPRERPARPKGEQGRGWRRNKNPTRARRRARAPRFKK